MENLAPFCTCGDTSCPNHPANNPHGCTDCMKKNLSNGEVPSCLFKLVHKDISHLKEYTIESFVHFYLDNKE